MHLRGTRSGAAERARRAASDIESLPLPFEVVGAVCCTDQAEFHPLKYPVAIVDETSSRGCLIFEHTCAIRLKRAVTAARVRFGNGSVVLAPDTSIEAIRRRHNLEPAALEQIERVRSC